MTENNTPKTTRTNYNGSVDAPIKLQESVNAPVTNANVRQVSSKITAND